LAVTNAPTVAIGYTQQVPSYSWYQDVAETTPELQWPQSVEVFDAMRRTDSQCASVLRAVTLPVRRTPWRIDPNGARAEVVEHVANDLSLPIVGSNPKPPPRTRDRFSWLEHLRLALLMLPMGHSFFEQEYRIDPDGRRAHLRKLSWRPPRTIERINVARDGGLVSITQYSTLDNSGPQKPIPVKQLVAYVHEREGGNWLGSSILRSAYKNWLLKDRLLRVQAQTIERNGMGIPLYTAQEGASPDDMAKGLAMATAWRAGEAAGSAVPFGANLVLRGVEGDLPDADPVVRYHDEAIARAVLAHFLNLGTQTGSWALGTTFADFFTLSLQTLAQQIADVATQHIIEDLVDLNWGESEPAPKLTFDEIGSRKSASAPDIRGLIESGALTLDKELEEALRQWYGLPPRSPGAVAAYEQPPVSDEQVVQAIDTYTADEVAASYNPSQARHLKGEHLGKIPIGGRWRKLLGGARGVLDIARALDAWVAGEGPDQPLDGFTVPALRRAAKIMDLDHRGGRDELVGRIKDDVRRKVAGQRKAKADLADYTYGAGFDRPKARDAEGRLRDVTISQGRGGLRVSLLDERGNRVGTAVTVANWAQLRTWARREKLKDLAGWVDKYHPTTRTARGRRDKRLGELLATLRRYDTYEEAELLLHGLELAELADLYTHLGGNLAVLPTTPTGRVSTRALVGAILADWPTLRSVGELDQTGGDPMARPARGSTPEGVDAVDDSGVYGSPADWGEAGFDVGYPPDEIRAAAGADITPGHDELHHYWTRGKGLARWVESPMPWRTLLANLVEEVHDKPLEVLKKWTSRWFIEVFGFAAGSDLNRVTHGRPPRGKLVGPG